MKHKYLEELKLNGMPYIYEIDKNKERQKIFEKQKEEFGFDERETWSLDNTFVIWLYERLSMYKKTADVDLEVGKFEHNGNTYNHIEIINEMLKLCKEILENTSSIDDDLYFSTMKKLTELWSLSICAMWW